MSFAAGGARGAASDGRHLALAIVVEWIEIGERIARPRRSLAAYRTRRTAADRAASSQRLGREAPRADSDAVGAIGSWRNDHAPYLAD